MTEPKLFGGVEAGGTKFICGVADERGALLDQIRISTTTPQVTLSAASDFFDRIQRRHGRLSALSIGSFGPLSLDPSATDFGQIVSTPKAGWSGVDLIGHFRQGVDAPIILETDVNCAAVGELLFGAGKGLNSLCYITVGTGIGVGLLIGGAPHRGANHPEAGHIRVPRAPGDQAFDGVCRFHGDCVEGLASGPAIRARWGLPAETLPPDHPCWGVVADYIASLCASLTYIVRPERIVIGGGVMQQPTLHARTRASLREKLGGYDASLSRMDLDAYIARSTAGASAGLTGALAIAYRRIARQWPAQWADGDPSVRRILA